MKCLCCVRPRTHHCKIVLLDEQELLQEIQTTTLGQEILDTVFRHLNLLETSYFGLRYLDGSNQTHWLDPTKRVVKQLKGKDSLTLYFGVKFYAVDPCKLLEEITRYQFFLQIKQDILQGRLPVSFELSAELGAYVVQSELGDYDPRRHSPGYVSEFRFTSHQSAALESRVAELHRDLSGQTPSQAELNYLDRVKNLPLYGVDLHPVLGEDSIEYFLGLTPAGIVVLRNKIKVASYLWPKITKIYSKGKYFMIRVCDKTDEENTYGFETPSRSACKHLYKCCVDHHSFFRLVQVSSNPPPDIISSRFSSGRGDKFSGGGRGSQMTRNPPSFTRTPSKRYQRRSEGGEEHPPQEEGGQEGFVRSSSRGGLEGVYSGSEMKSVSVPQPVSSMGYHPTRSDSPRSTRSAPWVTSTVTGPHQPRGLFSQSPRSVRSAGVHTFRHSSQRKKRSSSVESRSSNESKHCRRRRRSSRGKRGSDNESEHSRCSSRHRRRRHRSRAQCDGGSERGAPQGGSERGGTQRGSERGARIKASSEKQIYELVDSESQWKQVQLRRASIQQAAIVRPKSGYMNSGLETESEYSYQHQHRRKHRKHSSRSRSPSECASGKSSSRLPPELQRALEFSLVDTEGMSAAQLRAIPYTEVKTSARVKLSPVAHKRHHHRHSSRAKSTPDKDVSGGGTEPHSLPPNHLMGGGESPPPPYSESSTSSLNKSGDGAPNPSGPPSALNPNGPQPQSSGGTQQRTSTRSSARHCTSALYSHPATLLGNPTASSPWLDNPSAHNPMSRRPSDHTLSSSGSSGTSGKPFVYSSLRLPHSNSAQQFPTNTTRAHHHTPNPNYRWHNSEIRGVGLSYCPMGSGATPKGSLYPTPPTSGSQSDLLDSIQPSQHQNRHIYNRGESLSSDNLLSNRYPDSMNRHSDSINRTQSSISSDNLLNSTYADEESRQCNELIDLTDYRTGSIDNNRISTIDSRKSNRQDERYVQESNYRSQYIDSRNHCDNDNLALENRLQNIHLNQNIGEGAIRYEKLDNRLSNTDNIRLSNTDSINRLSNDNNNRISNIDSSNRLSNDNNRLSNIENNNRLSNDNNRISNIENNNRLSNDNNRISTIDRNSVKVESGVLKRYTNTPSGGVVPWPGGDTRVGYQGTNQNQVYQGTNQGYSGQSGLSNQNQGHQGLPNQSQGYQGATNQGTSLNGSNVNGMRAYQQFNNQQSSENPGPNNGPLALGNSMEGGPNAAALQSTFGATTGLGFHGDSGGAQGGLRQELMNTLSDASTTWDGLPITQYNHPYSVANNTVVPSNGWAEESALSQTNISGIAPLSRSGYSPHATNQEIVITPNQLASMLTPMSTRPLPSRPNMGCPAPGPTMASTPKVGHGPNPAPNGGPNMPSTSNVGPASTPKVGPNTAPGTNIGYTNSDTASNIGPHPNAGPTGKPSSTTTNSDTASNTGPTGKVFTTPSGGPRLVTSTPKSSPAEPSLQFSNQSAVAPDSSKLDTLLDETEVAGQWETRELGRERTSINCSTNAGGRAASGNSHATNSSSANGSATNGSSHQTNANRNETNGNGNASNTNRTNSHATNAIRTNSCATNANSLATNTNNGAKPPSGLNRQARQNQQTSGHCQQTSRQNQSDLPGIHRSCVQKSTNGHGDSRNNPSSQNLHSTNQNFTDGQNLNPTNTSTTDFQTDVSTAMDTMESGESNEESCVSGAQLPNNINERVNTYKNSNGNADRNSNDRNADRNSNRNSDRNSNDRNIDRKSDRNARPPPLETTIDRVIDMQPISNRNIDSNPLPVLETTIDRPVDNQSISNRNINHGTASMDLNRNNLSTIDEFETFGPSGAGFVGSKFETFGPSTAGFGESTVDNSIYRNNDNERWSTFDYSGSISNNNLEESVATANSQLSGSGSSPGSGKSNVVAKNKRYHEMCTEL